MPANTLLERPMTFLSGDHKVTVTYGGKKIKGSPYTVRVYDTGRVAVSNMPSSGLLGQPVVFDSK